MRRFYKLRDRIRKFRRKHKVDNILVHFSRVDRSWTQRLVLWFYFKWRYLTAGREGRARIRLIDEIFSEIEKDSSPS